MLLNVRYLFIAVASAHAAVYFTAPQAGATVNHDFTAAWQDDGTPPVYEDLSKYGLYLMVGGGAESNPQTLHRTSLDDEDALPDLPGDDYITIWPSLMGPIENGFYLMMVARARPGGRYNGTITFFSDRFSIEGLNGSTPPELVRAVAAIEGTDGPATNDYLTETEDVESTTRPTDDLSSSSAAWTYATTYGPDLGPTTLGSSTTSSTTRTSPDSDRSADPDSRRDDSIDDSNSMLATGVGVGLGGSLVIAIIILVWHKRSKRLKAKQGQTAETTIEKAELSGRTTGRLELDTADVPR